MMTMNANEITKQVIDFQKGAFSSWYGALSIVQDQVAEAMDTMLNQTNWIPDEGRQAILSWMSTCRNERNRFKDYVEESLSGLEKYLVQEMASDPVKPQKPVGEEKKAASPKPQRPAVEEKKAAPAQETKPSVQ